MLIRNWTKMAVLVGTLTVAWPAFAQQGYPLVPFQCPAGQSVFSFNPNFGSTGWMCQQTPGSSSVNGTFTCPSLTLQNGVVVSAANGTCGSIDQNVLGTGTSITACLGTGTGPNACLGTGS